MFDFDIFLNNIMTIVDSKCGGSQKEFNRRIDDRDAITKWKMKKTKPSLEILFRIAQEFNCSFDWLLTGKDRANDFTCGWSQEAIEAFNNIKEILESDDTIARTALMSNLTLYKESVRRKNRIDVLEDDVNKLKKSIRGPLMETSPRPPGLRKKIAT
jgi:transcriptional regulator with XRE-family HTH domain